MMPTEEQKFGGGAEKWGAFFGPTAIDNMLREAIKMCWMALPQEKRSVNLNPA